MKDFLVINVVNYYYPTLGGLSTSLMNYKKQLNELGIDNSILSYPYLFRKIENLFYYVPFIKKLVHFIGVFLFLLYAELFIFFKNFQYRSVIIHSHSANFCALVGVISKIFGTRTVHTFRTDFKIDNEKVGIVKRVYDKFIYKNTDELTAVSKHLADQYKNIFSLEKNVQVIYQSPDFEFFKTEKKPSKKIKKKSNEKFILFVGNFIKLKDPLTLLKAFKILKENDPDLRLIMIGKGNLESEMKKFIQQKDLDEKVSILSGIPYNEISYYYNLCDVFVLPSLGEGLSNSIIEAMVCQKPVVSTRTGGNELIVDKKTGYLFKTKDYRDLSNKIELALKNKKIGKQAYKYLVTNFSLKKEAQKYLELYRISYQQKKEYKKGVSIIIKTYNEEENISKAIKSCLPVIKKHKGEILIADSLSTDKTIKRAKKYPVRVIQINNEEERKCSVGPYIGFKEVNYEYVYLLDGDMVLKSDFVDKAMNILNKNKKLAGVGGKVIHEKVDNLLNKRSRKKLEEIQYGDVEYLDGGGLYKSEIIEEIGHFSNPNLHSYEEADLGFKIVTKGYNLRRIDNVSAQHYPHTGSSLSILINRLKSGYLMGAGEVLKYNLGTKRFFKHLNKLKLYPLVFFFWLILPISYYFNLLVPFMILSLVGFLLVIIRKKNLEEALLSVLSWNLTVLASLVGFLKPQKPINRIIDYDFIKK